jgi:hypothetical protein
MSYGSVSEQETSHRKQTIETTEKSHATVSDC